jgi:hypothetical protein
MGRAYLSLSGKLGFDHGVGHPPLLLCNTKAPNYRNKKAFKDLGHYSEWPKVADAVIEAEKFNKEMGVKIKALRFSKKINVDTTNIDADFSALGKTDYMR